MRKTTCSSEPGGIVLTMVASKASKDVCRPGSRAYALRKSTVVASWPRLVAARAKSRTCQPPPEERIAMRIGLGSGFPKKRLVKHFGLYSAKFKCAARLQVAE